MQHLASPAVARPSCQTLGIESSAHAMNSRNRFAAPTAPLRVQGERSPLSLASKAALVLVALQVAISFVHLPFVVFLAQAGAMSVVHMLKLLASSVFLFVGTALFVARVRAASYFLAASFIFGLLALLSKLEPWPAVSCTVVAAVTCIACVRQFKSEREARNDA